MCLSPASEFSQLSLCRKYMVEGVLIEGFLPCVRTHSLRPFPLCGVQACMREVLQQDVSMYGFLHL